jgi:transcriptional regulator GlxA family with amidase domain
LPHHRACGGNAVGVRNVASGFISVTVATTFGKGGGRRSLDSRIQALVERIATKPDDDHSMSALAEAARLSTSRLAHLFKAKIGRSPVRFVQETRLKEAVNLIELTPARVAEIARQVGFRSPFHFSSTFRERYGASPRAHRQGFRLDTDRI